MRQSPVERLESAELCGDRRTRLGVVADTHSQPHPAMLGQMTALAPDLILHAGDIGKPAVLDALCGIAPVFAVRGNTDPRRADLADTVILELRGADRHLRILLTHIGLYGPKLRADVQKRALARGASLVVCGHSHVPFIGRQGALTLFNPGSAGPRRFQLPIVFGIIDVTGEELRMAHVDCETGRAWLPPGN